MNIFALAAIAILLVLAWKFADVLLSLAFRVATSAACIGLAYVGRQCVAEALIEVGVVTDEVLAEIVAFFVVLFALAFAVTELGRVTRCDRPNSLSAWGGAVADLVRTGLIGSALFLLGVTAYAVATGEPVEVSITGLIVAAVLSSLYHAAISQQPLPARGHGSSTTTD